LSERVADAYYQTTAGRSHEASIEYYENATQGLRLKLQPWLQKTSNRDVWISHAAVASFCTWRKRKDSKIRPEWISVRRNLSKPTLRTGILVHADVLTYLKEAESASFDFVSALNLLEHLSKDKLLAVMTECRRVLSRWHFGCHGANAVSPFGGLHGTGT